MALEWERLGLVFSPQDLVNRPWWLHSHAQAPATLPLPDRIRTYFSCRPAVEPSGQYVSYTGYVDLDPSNPTRIIGVGKHPVMGLGDLGTFDEFGIYPFSAIHTPDSAEILGYYGGWTRCESVPFNVAIGVARSLDDGESFERLGAGPVISYSPDEPFVMSGPKIRRFGGTYQLFYIAGKKWKLVEGRREPIYRIRMATSDDGLRWTKVGEDLIPPRIEADEAQASPDVFFRNGHYHMLFSYRRSSDFRDGPGSYQLGYAWSTDLFSWTRDDGNAGLGVDPGNWDSEMIAYPHVFESAGDTYLAYLGNGVGRRGFGLARLTKWDSPA